MLTVGQAAERAAISPSLVYQWIAEGTLPCFRLGGKGKRGTIRITIEDLDQVMSSFKLGKPPPSRPERVTLKHRKA